MDHIDKIDNLPNVRSSLLTTFSEYNKTAFDFLSFKSYCLSGLAEVLDKVQEWCIHLRCIKENDPCLPLSFDEYENNQLKLKINSTIIEPTNVSLSQEPYLDFLNGSENVVYNYMLSIGFNSSKCYDDYLCDTPFFSSANHYVLGLFCFMLCIFGIISNLSLLPAYNFGLNRSGATVYLTIMALFDCAYLVLTLLIYVSRYIYDSFSQQVTIYGQFSGYFIPVGLPFMQLCDQVVLWITIALLVNRLMYLKLGTHSKMLCSQLESFKVITTIILLCFAYFGCKFFEYTLVKYEDFKVTRVVLTQIGKTEIFQNLFHHWLKVPLEMFLPYLGCGVLISVVVSNMINLNKSKWKAVASLCTDTACACVCRTGVCGAECREGVQKKNSWSSTNNSEKEECVTKEPMLIKTLDEQKLGTPDNDFVDGDRTIRFLDPIEQELAYLFFQMPHVDETRENANVVTAVCIGLIMLLCKIPKIFLHILSTENYVEPNAGLFLLINQILDTSYASLKPLVCILVGAHFRKALLSPRAFCRQSANLKANTSFRNSFTTQDVNNRSASMLLDQPKDCIQLSPFKGDSSSNNPNC